MEKMTMYIPESTATLDDIATAGYEHGYDLASWQDLPEIGETVPREIDWIGIGEIKSLDDAEEAFIAICDAADDNCRQFSPFEFLAHALNEREDADEAWESFTNAMTDGFLDNWNERAPGYYEVE